MAEPQINEDLRVQRWLWRFERAGWVWMAMMVGCAAAGLFGGGPLAAATAGDETLQVKFDRFARNKAPVTLELELEPKGRVAELSINQSFLERVKIESIEPEPDRTVAGDGRVTYHFIRDPAAQQIALRLQVTPEHAGRLQAELSLDGGDPITIRQLIYP